MSWVIKTLINNFHILKDPRYHYYDYYACENLKTHNWSQMFMMKHTKNEPFSIKCYYCLKCNSTLGYFKSKDEKFSNIRYDSINNRDGTYKCNVEVMARACL